jgi:cell division protein FtsB
VERGTNLVPFQRKGVFHLTQVSANFVLGSGMTRSNTKRSNGRLMTAVVGLYDRGNLGWRKVATVAAAALAMGLGYHVVFGQNGLTAYEQKRLDTQSLKLQLQSLQRENEQLKGHVDLLQTDPDAIEHQAREELHYTRPGEVIYTLPASSAVSVAKK